MSLNNKIIRHWFGFAHGWLTMLTVAWLYEGKYSTQDPRFILLIVVGVLMLFLLAVTGERIVKEIEQ